MAVPNDLIPGSHSNFIINIVSQTVLQDDIYIPMHSKFKFLSISWFYFCEIFVLSSPYHAWLEKGRINFILNLLISRASDPWYLQQERPDSEAFVQGDCCNARVRFENWFVRKWATTFGYNFYSSRLLVFKFSHWVILFLGMIGIGEPASLTETTGALHAFNIPLVSVAPDPIDQSLGAKFSNVLTTAPDMAGQARVILIVHTINHSNLVQ